MWLVDLLMKPTRSSSPRLSIDEAFQVTISGIDCNFTATTTVKADAIDGLGLAISNEFPGVFNIAKLAGSIRLSSRASEVSRTISVSNNLTLLQARQTVYF